jgi:hypothetical protein
MTTFGRLGTPEPERALTALARELAAEPIVDHWAQSLVTYAGIVSRSDNPNEELSWLRSQIARYVTSRAESDGWIAPAVMRLQDALDAALADAEPLRLVPPRP